MEQSESKQLLAHQLAVPISVKIGAAIWCLIGLAISILLLIPVFSGDEGIKAGYLIALILPIGFIYFGVQTFQGKAKDVLGNGIGALLFGLGSLAQGVTAIVATGASPVSIGYALPPTLLGLLLTLSGVLALHGRKQYKSSRKSP